MRKIRTSTLIAITSAVCMVGAGVAVAAPEVSRAMARPAGEVAVTFAKPVGTPTPTPASPPPAKHLGPVTISAEAHKRLIDGAYRAVGKAPPAAPAPELMKVSFPFGAKMSLNSALQWVTTANFALMPSGQVECWVTPTADAPAPTPTSWPSGTALRILAQNFVAGNPYVLECTGMPSPTTTTPVSEVPVNFYVSFQTSLGGSPASPSIPEQKVSSIPITGGRGMAIAFAAPSVTTWVDIRVAHPQIHNFIFDTCTISNLN